MQEKRKTSHRERGTGRISFIARHAVVENHCDGEIVLKTAMSATVQLPRAERYRLTHFAGDSCAEYRRQETILTQSRTVFEISCLTDAACHIVPFFALDDGHATETHGEDFVFSAVRGDRASRLVELYSLVVLVEAPREVRRRRLRERSFKR